ncbi:MAG TPA: zinc ribbon domain-containing protein [Blastocatellia bacterium]|nr:zinc ribbon domain-containing protein [Blastocatellia bacterium]
MLRNCPDCERDATLGARFCRTCGGRLFPESEVTAATTRHYSPEQAAAAQYAEPGNSSGASNNAPPFATAEPVTASVDTARLYHAPQSPQVYNYEVATPPKKSWRAVWITLTIMIVLFIGSVGFLFTAARHAGLLAPRDRAPRRDFPRIPPPPDQPPPPPPGQAKQLTIEDLKYPGATVEKNVKPMGQEIIEMTTEDDLTEVRDFYKEKLGVDPVDENKKENSIVFTTEAPSIFVVTAKPDERDTDKIKIVIIHPNVPFFGKFGPRPGQAEEQLKRQQEELKRHQEELKRQQEEIRRRATGQQ